MSTYTTKAKAWLRQLKHGYTDMGGYPLYAVCEDSGVLCPKCCTKEAKLIMRAGQDRDKQWQLAGVDVNYEDAELFCDHCNKRIESAYAEDEATRKSNPMGHVEAPFYTRVSLQFRNANTQADVATSCRCVVEQKEKRTDPWVHVDGGHWTTESNARIDMRNMKAMYDVEDRSRNPLGNLSSDEADAQSALRWAFGDTAYGNLSIAHRNLLIADLVDMWNDEQIDDLGTAAKTLKRRIGTGNLLAYTKTLAAGRNRNPKGKIKDHAPTRIGETGSRASKTRAGRCYMVVGPMCWGKGDTVEQALKRAKNNKPRGVRGDYEAFDVPDDAFVDDYNGSVRWADNTKKGTSLGLVK